MLHSTLLQFYAFIHTQAESAWTYRLHCIMLMYYTKQKNHSTNCNILSLVANFTPRTVGCCGRSRFVQMTSEINLEWRKDGKGRNKLCTCQVCNLFLPSDMHALMHHFFFFFRIPKFTSKLLNLEYITHIKLSYMIISTRQGSYKKTQLQTNLPRTRRGRNGGLGAPCIFIVHPIISLSPLFPSPFPPHKQWLAVDYSADLSHDWTFSRVLSALIARALCWLFLAFCVHNPKIMSAKLGD
jgi:hypothetical protein